MSFPRTQHLRIPNNNGLSVFYSPKIAVSSHEQEVLANELNPRRFAIIHKLNNRSPDALNWRFTANTSLKALPRAVLRNYTTRKWRAAFLHALKEHGYDSQGMRPAPSSGGSKSVGIRGTLDILIQSGYGFDLPMEELIQRTRTVLSAVLNQQSNGNGTKLKDKPKNYE